INENPTIDDISSNSPVCEGGTLNLSVTAIGGSGPYTYSWSGPDGFTSTNQNPTISNVTLLNSGDYDVVVTDANGCGSATSSVSVVINENPVIDNISNNGPVCAGSTLDLSVTVSGGTAPYTYSWSGPDGFISTAQNPSIANATTANAGDYDVVVTDANGCNSVTGTTTVVVSDPVIDNISNDGPVCEGADINLSVAVSGGIAPYSYSWSGPDGFTSTDQNPTVTNVAVANAGIYNVTITDSNGCFVTGTTTVVINENPTIDDISSNSPVCEGGTLNLSVTAIGGSGPYTYSWSGPDGFTSTDQNPTISNVTLLNNGDYDVVVTDANGCGSATSSVSVVINENPVIDNISNNGPVCAGSTLDLSVTVSGGTAPYTYSWSGPDGFSSTAQNPSIANATTANAGDYDVVVTDANGCNSVTGTTTVVVSDPVIDNISNDGPVCEEADINLSVAVSGGIAPYSYSWSGPDGFTSTDQNPTVTNVAVANAGIYDVTITDSNGCFVTGTTTVVINENPTIDDISSNSPVCEGGTLNLSVTAIGGSGPYTYSWSGPDGFTSTDQNPTISNVTLLNNGDYDVVVTDANGCGSVTSSVSVVINENPVIDNISNNGPICAGSTLDLSVTVSGGTAPYTYSWSGPDGFSSTAQNPSIANATTANAGDYDVVVTDANGCNSVTSSTTVVVNDLPIVNFPDASTCDGQDVTLTATPSGGGGNYVNYIWYNGGSTEIQSGTSDQLTLTGTDVELANNGATYSATVEDNNGCISAVDDMTLTVNENPSVEILYNTNPETAIDVCLGSSMTLDAQGSGGTGAYTYTWELPDGTTQTGAQVVVDPMALTDGGAYTVSVNDGNCVGTQTIDVTVVEVTATIAVTAPVAGATTICESTSVTFEAGGGDNYEFYHFDSSAGTTTMVYDAGNEWTTSTLEDGDQIYVTAFNALGCSDDSDPITMTVIANPTVAIDYPAGEDNEVCFGEDLSVVADPAGYSNYDFYIFDGTDHIKVSPDGYSSEAFTYPSDSFTDGDEFYIVASSGVGCSGESAHETVVVHTLPNATAANSGPECVGETISLQGGDAGLDSYEWFAPGADLTTDAPIATSMDHDLTNIASSDAGIYTLRVTNVNGCQATATTEVVVNELPVVSLPADYSVCEGTQNHEITATITNGTAPYNVVWEFDDGSGATTVLSGQDETIFSIGSVSAANEGTYTVTVTDANGCVSVQDNVYLTVDAAPGVAFDASSVTEVCDGAQVTLTAFGNGGVVSGSNTDDYEYVWYHEGTLINGVSTATYQFTGDNGINDGLYEVVAIDDNGNGCASPVASMNVTVYELPDATLDVNPAFFIEGTEVTFTAVDGYTSYEFQVNGTTVQGPGVDYVYQDATLQDGDEVTVFVTEDHGAIQCTNSSTVTMTVFDSVEQPVVSVTDEEYCAGAAGATVNVTNPQQDVTYEMVYDDGTAVSGYNQIVYDGTNSVSWSNVLDDNGGTSTPTTFRVKAFWAALTPDGDQLSDPFDITENPVPNQFTMSVDGNSAAGGLTETNCNAGTGYTIGLYDGWQSVDYYLILNGTQVLEVKSGSGVVSEFIFDDTYSYVGEYTIVAQNEFGCTTDILGSFIIEGDEVVIFDLNGENNGQYCEGDADGVELILSGSETGIEYELFRDGMSLGTFTGDGNPLSFGNYTEEGIYRVSVTSAGGCLYAMNNDVTVDMVAAPDEGILTDVNTNNFHFCEGSEGVDIYQDVVQIENYTYELVGPEGVVSTHTGDNSGTGITYEDITVPGEYFVRVTAGGGIGCSSETDVIQVVEDELPNIETVKQYTDLCDISGSTAIIGIDVSQTNVEYRWVDVADNNNTSSWDIGTGGRLDLVVTTAGEYLIQARNTQSGCEVEMDGTVNVELRPLPASNITVLESGGADCTNGLVLTLDNPEAGVVYQLYKEDISGDPVYVQDPVTGDGTSSLFFDPIVDSDANYYISATSEYGCPVVLDGAPWYVDISGALQKFALRPETGDICNGEDGVSFYLENSEDGVQYVLSLEGAGDTRNDTVTSVGGGMVEFGPVIEEGTYYVTGLSASDENCNSEMLNRVDLVVRPLPKAFGMIGPGTYCDPTEGVTLGLDNSQSGFEYLLQQHTSAGKRNIERFVSTTEGDTIQFTTQLFEDGTDNIYSVVSISPFGCTSSMKDSIEVKESGAIANPVIIDNEGADNDTVFFCDISGEYYTIELQSPQMDDGISYQVFDADGVMVAESTVEAGLMEPLNVVDPGTYTVQASWEDGGCTTASDTLELIGSVPAEDMHEPVYSSRVCYGTNATIKYPDNSFGWTYTLMNMNESVEEVATFVSRDTINYAAGIDTIVWTVDTGGRYFINIQSEGGACDAVPTSNIDIQMADAIPMATFTAETYNYCHNSDRVEIEIENVTQSGNYVYRLIDADGNTYGAVFNDDAEFVFSPLVGEGAPTAYGLLGKDIDSGCEFTMDVADFADIVQYPVPEVYEVIKDTIIFDPESGIEYSVGLTDYEERVVYDMYYESGDEVFSSTSGEAFNIPVETIEQEGDYFIYARHLDAPDCDPIEIGSVFMKEKGITPFNFSLADGRTDYCEGQVVRINLSNSQPGVEYQLFRNGEPVGNRIISYQTGSTITFRDDSYIGEITFEDSRVDVNYTIIGFFGDETPVPMTPEGDEITATIWENPDDKVIRMETQNGDVSLGGQCSPTQPINVIVESPDINNRYFVEFIPTDSIHLEGQTFHKLDSTDVKDYYDEIDFEVETAGFYRISVSNSGCRNHLLEDTVEIRQFRDPIAEDFLMRIPSNQISGTINVMENAITDPLLDIDDYKYEWVYPVPYDTVSFSWIDADVEFIYDDYSGKREEWNSPFIQYTRPAGFVGKDSVRYTIGIGVCPDSKIDTGLITVIVGNETLPDEKEVLIPNAFSPNGDGMNDYFVLSGIPDEGQTTLTVFNRWGNVVYESEGRRYQNDWDGKSNMSNMVSIGEDLPNGVYFYILTVKMTVDTTLKTKEYNGFIELRR
ncbi:PKD domain-containing protein, partial [Marinilabilia salmonicolor]